MRIRCLTAGSFNIRYKILMWSSGVLSWYSLKMRNDVGWRSQSGILMKQYLFSSGVGKLMDVIMGLWVYGYYSQVWWASVSLHEGAGDDCVLWSQSARTESQLCEWLAVSSWTRLLLSLCLSFLICKMEMLQPTS